MWLLPFLDSLLQVGNVELAFASQQLKNLSHLRIWCCM